MKPNNPTMAEPFGLKLYRTASRASGPIARFALQRRLSRGKEDANRITERQGIAGVARPEGELVWIHGASVGESLSVLPLVERLQEQAGHLKFLVTTGTVTSARLMAERLNDGAIHQFIPLDHPQFVNSFLDHWRPQAAIFVESEFWPNLVLGARQRAKTMALVNGRVSPRSFEDWVRKPQTIRYVLSSFDIMIAQDRQNAERLRTLSGRDVPTFGNLKNAAPPLPAEPQELETLRTQIGDRAVWLAASTHPGEEDAVFEAHRSLKAEFPNILTVLAPRHPERGAEINSLAKEYGLRTVRRSETGQIETNTDIYIADTLGELGLFYRAIDISFVGGGLTPKGGHNPLEPARLGGAILHGPYIFNFAETYEELRAAGGAALVRNDRELATAVRRLLADEKTRTAMADAAKTAADASAAKVLTSISDLLLEMLNSKNSAA